MKRSTFLISLFITLTILDVHSTHLALQQFGVSERNPIAKTLISTLGLFGAMMVLKPIAVITVYIFRKKPHYCKTMIIINLFYAFVVVSNYSKAF